MTVAGHVLIALGGTLLVVAAAGLFVLRDALARQHAATKAGTLAVGLILAGTAMAAGGGAEWWWRVAAVAVWLLVTLPVASHMLARSAYRACAPCGIRTTVPTPPAMKRAP
jgi:multicomponent Na+:H+ antiporter subunit G